MFRMLFPFDFCSAISFRVNSYPLRPPETALVCASFLRAVVHQPLKSGDLAIGKGSSNRRLGLLILLLTLLLVILRLVISKPRSLSVLSGKLHTVSVMKRLGIGRRDCFTSRVGLHIGILTAQQALRIRLSKTGGSQKRWRWTSVARHRRDEEQKDERD